MSELRSIVVTVCCVVGVIFLIGGLYAYHYTTYPYGFYWGEVHPYRVYGVPFIICGIALLIAGVIVELGGLNVKVDVD